MKYRVSIRKTMHETWLVEAKNADAAANDYLDGDMIYDKETDTSVINVEPKEGYRGRGKNDVHFPSRGVRC